MLNEKCCFVWSKRHDMIHQCICIDTKKMKQNNDRVIFIENAAGHANAIII